MKQIKENDSIEKQLHYTQKRSLKRLNNNLTLVIGVLSLIIIVMSLSLYKLSNKAPIVIREFSNGSIITNDNYLATDRVHKFDIMAFSKLFLKRYHTISSFGVNTELTNIYYMMTPKRARKFKQYIIDKKLISLYRSTGAFDSWTLEKISISRVDSPYIYVKFLGNQVMMLTSANQKLHNTINGELVLKIVKRNKTAPFGVLMSHINETVIYNNTKKIKTNNHTGG